MIHLSYKVKEQKEDKLYNNGCMLIPLNDIHTLGEKNINGGTLKSARAKMLTYVGILGYGPKVPTYGNFAQ